jgi:AcrR family transcriptional regulator
VSSALDCFAEQGYHGTSVEEIAARAGISRATLYQYFASKDDIFIELMTESGSALTQVNKQLGSLGPTADGFTSLQQWLVEWTSVFERYAPMFIEWTHVNTPKAPLRPRIAGFVDAHANRFSKCLGAGGEYSHGDARALSILALALVSRTLFTTHVFDTGLSRDQTVRSLAIAVQLLLFPDTPSSVLGSPWIIAPPSGETRRGEVRTAPATLPRPGTGGARPLDDLGRQAATTVRRLLDASARVFADTGFDGANVDMIVTEGHVARGTFYRYFDDKADVLAALARECADALTPSLRQLADPAVHSDGPALRGCLANLMRHHSRYAGVLRAWAEGSPENAALMSPCGEVIVEVRRAADAMLGTGRNDVFDAGAAAVMLSAAIEHYPTEASGTKASPTFDTLVDSQALFVERVLLDR